MTRPEFDVSRFLTAAVLAGAVRLFLEWSLGGAYLYFPVADLAHSVAFYLALAVGYSVAVALAQGTAFREAAASGTRLAGLSAAAPLIDAAATGGKLAYGYAWGGLAGFPVTFYAPDGGLLLGEAAMVWAAALGAAVIVYRRRGAKRALAGFALAYAAAATLWGVLPGAAEAARASQGWPLEHRRTLLTGMLALAAYAGYLLGRPALAAGLARRSVHMLPFLACAAAGAAFAGEISAATLAYAALLAGVFATWLLQNDYYDAADDAAQGRAPYLDREDMRFATFAAVLLVAVPFSVNSLAALPLTAVLVTSTLYSAWFYRAKRYFPSNLKMEGVWGMSSFTLGVVSAVEARAYGAPRWWLAGPPEAAGGLGAFDTAVLAAIVLVFAGFSLVAVLKDYKDWAADRAARVQTVYTLAARRGLEPARVHGVMLAAAGAALAASAPLAAAAGRLEWFWSPAGPAAGLALFALLRGAPSAGRFRGALVLLAGYFSVLALAL